MMKKDRTDPNLRASSASFRGYVLACAMTATAFMSRATDAIETSAGRHDLVRTFGPAGYWPIDEGEGDVIHDRSGNDNHGRVFNLQWQAGLLDFTSGFQWAEIPSRPAYQSDSITLGGWYFTRRDDYLGGSDITGPKRNETDNHHTQGVSLINNAYGRRGGWVRWDGVANLQEGLGLRLRSPGATRSVGGTLLDVVHGNRGDSLDSAAAGIELAPAQWQHVLYTYHDGTGTLYLNGKPVQSKAGIRFRAADKSFVIGNDMSWWMLYPDGSQSLDGSIRDIVLFDRALSADEAARLVAGTHPDSAPMIYGADDIVIDGVHIPFDSLPEVYLEQRRRALEHWDRRPVDRLRAQADSVIPLLADALVPWQTRPLAASLLQKLDRPAARDTLQEALTRLFLPTLADVDAPQQARASSVLAIAVMGHDAKDAVPVLVEHLQSILDVHGARLPRIEDLLRNSLMRALLDIDPQAPRVREILGLALAKPIFDSRDLSREYLSEVRPLVVAERYLDALDIYRALPLKKHGEIYLSQGDRKRDTRRGSGLAYSSVVEHDGYTYTVGSGRAWDAAEKIGPEHYAAAIEDLPAEFREAARNWNHAASPDLCGIKIHKTDPQGQTQTVTLEGDWFIFEGSDAKLKGWTIDIDEQGYIHLLGGMHNYPNPALYVPGSWERLGLSRSRDDDTFPSVMYWVSRRPGDIDSFEFVGQRNNPRNLPCAGMNYMNLVRDPDNVMFLYGRISAQSTQSWGFFRYDAPAQRWQAVGGDAADVFDATRHALGNIFLQRGGRPWTPKPSTPEEKVFVWAWHPHFYNYIRGWGIRFDPSGRMHVRVPIRGLGVNSRIRDAQVYAYSDDRGHSFFRADGTPLKLPLTTNPAPGHHADLDHHFIRRWLDLWHSLLRHAGYHEF